MLIRQYRDHRPTMEGSNPSGGGREWRCGPFHREIAVNLCSALDIRQSGGRWSVLPGERLFPLSGSSTLIPDFICTGCSIWPAFSFSVYFINTFRGAPVIPISVYFHSWKSN